MVHWLEVEVKAKVEDVNRLRRKAKLIADFKKKESRGDDYFALAGRGYPKKAFRIRDDGEKMVVNFKKHLKHLWKDGIVVKAEHEPRTIEDDVNHQGIISSSTKSGYTGVGFYPANSVLFKLQNKHVPTLEEKRKELNPEILEIQPLSNTYTSPSQHEVTYTNQPQTFENNGVVITDLN